MTSDKMTIVNESVPPQIWNHTAVRLDHLIVVTGGHVHKYRGMLSTHRGRRIYTYNLYTEEWRQYIIPSQKQAPKSLCEMCGVRIGTDIFIFSAPIHVASNRDLKSNLWRLRRKTNGCFVWSIVLVKKGTKRPSPRTRYSSWAHNQKLWIFGGHGPSQEGYLNDYGDYDGLTNNQLLQFDFTVKKWSNMKCSGTIPAPRTQPATTIIGDSLFLFGGSQLRRRSRLPPDFYELYQLDMLSLTWTQIQTGEPKPRGLTFCSFNALTANMLVLHGGKISDHLFSDTWIMDVPSLTWRKHSVIKDNPRCIHTGSIGINKDVIIIGGIGGISIAGAKISAAAVHKDTFHVMLEPKSLQQLALKTVHKHQAELPLKIRLPKQLIKLMAS